MVHSLIGKGYVRETESKSGVPRLTATFRGYLIVLGFIQKTQTAQLLSKASKEWPFFTLLSDLLNHGFRNRTIDIVFLDPIRTALWRRVDVSNADERLLLAGLCSVIVDHVKVLRSRKRYDKEIASIGEFMYGLFHCLEEYDYGRPDGLADHCLFTIAPYYEATGESVSNKYLGGRVTNVRMKRFQDFLFELVSASHKGENAAVYLP